MNQPIRLALVGCGKIAEQHLRAITELNADVQIRALCDINKNNILRLVSNFRLIKLPERLFFTNYDELLRNDEIDCVIIATNSDTHSSLALKALQSGKHVLVEKPLSLSISEARLVVDEAEKRGKILAVALQVRYLPQIQAIKRAVDDGKFGKLVHGVVTVRWNRSREYYTNSFWRGSWEKDGGALMNQCIHYIDLLQWLMGEIRSVYGEATTRVQPIEAEDVGIAVLKFNNGAIGLVEGSTCVYPNSIQTSLSLFGEKGSVVIEGERLNRIGHWIFEDQHLLESPPKIGAISHTPLYKDLVSAIRDKTTPLVSGRSALLSLETVLAIYKSVQAGSPVVLPIENFGTKDMKIPKKF